MSRQGIKEAESLVLRQDFTCRDKGCLDKGIFGRDIGF